MQTVAEVKNVERPESTESEVNIHIKRHLKNIILLNIDLCACVRGCVRVCVLMNNKAILE